MFGCPFNAEEEKLVKVFVGSAILSYDFHFAVPLYTGCDEAFESLGYVLIPNIGLDMRR